MRFLVVLICLTFATQLVRADDLATAREHYRKATKAYELGLFDEAIQEFNLAYKAKDDPTILYNLAQSHRQAGHRAEALRTYRVYLMKVPDAPNRREVEALIATLSTAAHSDDPDSELARRYFEAGAAHYQAKRYAEAAVEFEKGRRVKASPAFDYNIARSYDRIGRTEDALAAYRRYLDSKPEDADETRARIGVLEKRLAEEKAGAPKPTVTTTVAPVAPVAPAATKPVDTHAGRTKKIAGIAVAAVGVAAIGAGIAMGVLAKSASDELTRANRDGKPFDAAKYSTGKSEDIAGGVLLGVGGAAVVAGVVVAVLGVRESHARTVAFAPWIGASSAGAALEWRLP